MCLYVLAYVRCWIMLIVVPDCLLTEARGECLVSCIALHPIFFFHVIGNRQPKPRSNHALICSSQSRSYRYIYDPTIFLSRWWVLKLRYWLRRKLSYPVSHVSTCLFLLSFIFHMLDFRVSYCEFHWKPWLLKCQKVG